MTRKIGDRVVLTDKALKLRPDLRRVVGKVSYRPLMAKQLNEKRMHLHYNVDFGEGRRYMIPANQLKSV